RSIAIGALLFALGAMVGMAVQGAPMKSRVATNGSFAMLLSRILAPYSIDLYIAILAVPFFIWAARRWPAVRPLSRRGLAIQLLLILAVSATTVFVLYLVMRFGRQVPVSLWFMLVSRVGP